MQLQQTLQPVLRQLADTLLQLEEGVYTTPSIQLNGATVGAHTRHVIELFQCLLLGYEQGIVNYDQRRREILIETDRQLAFELLLHIISNTEKENRLLMLYTGHAADASPVYALETNYYREILFNLEHAIHHMALIRIGIQEASSLVLHQSFGVAASTIQYRQACAQ